MKRGDLVQSKSMQDSPVWIIEDILIVGPYDEGVAYLKLRFPRSWAPGPIMTRRLPVSQLEPVNEMLAIALITAEWDELVCANVEDQMKDHFSFESFQKALKGG